MTLRLSILPLFFALACNGNGNDNTGQNRQGIQRIPCQTTPDCAARGGMCVAGQCAADNECATGADCSAGEVCTADVNFGGLCGPAGSTPIPGPAWACTADADCPTGQSCLRGTCGVVAAVEDCVNGTDDDADGDIDCADTDCVRTPACTGPIEDCVNGSDDDGDADIDCADSDCAFDPACTESDCGNAIDDDADGDIDCADFDCARDPACAPPAEDCANGTDDNGDGAIDCADVQCVREPICQGGGCNGTNCPCDVLLQNCASPTDRCYPGGPDSADGQCYGTGGQSAGNACIEPPVNTPDACQAGLLCIYEAEMDPTGICRTICATSADCAAGELCYALFPQPTNYGICHPPPVESCANGTDDDNDGAIDCADTDCSSDPSCAPPQEDCSNMIDDDGDGAIDCFDTDCANFPRC